MEAVAFFHALALMLAEMEHEKFGDTLGDVEGIA